MKHLIYHLTTPIKKQRADLAEWRILNYKFASLRLDRLCTYDSLIRNFAPDEDINLSRACVKRRIAINNAGYLMPPLGEEFCPHFNPNDLNGRCKDETCPFYQRNNAFFNIINCYNNTLRNMQEFWNNKLNQNSK